LSELDWQSIRRISQGVYHANWDCLIMESDIDNLVFWAQGLDSRKSRLCLHENPESLMQVTYLAFVRPYSDKVHKHPYRPEVLIPIRGEAIRRTYSEGLEVESEVTMKSGFGNSFSILPGMWHSLEVVSEHFVMIEIGAGPFTKDSTVFKK